MHMMLLNIQSRSKLCAFVAYFPNLKRPFIEDPNSHSFTSFSPVRLTLIVINS